MQRLFIGLDIPQTDKDRLALLRLAVPGARWVAPENYHITLCFLGTIDQTQKMDAVQALRTLSFPSFSLQLHGVGHFGGRKARSLWTGLAVSAPLNLLQSKIQREMQQLGLVQESRNFTPHVTLARFNHGKASQLAEFLSHFAHFSTPEFSVNQFTLFSARSLQGGGPYLSEADFLLQNEK